MKLVLHVILFEVMLLARAFGQSAPVHLSTWNDLDNLVASSYEKIASSPGSLCPPGPYTVNAHLGFFTFSGDGELATIKDLSSSYSFHGVQIWSLRVVETQMASQVWLYLGEEATPIRAHPVPDTFDPRSWVRKAYGTPPPVLSSVAPDEWYANRDRSRTQLEFSLVESNNWATLETLTGLPSAEMPPPVASTLTVPVDTNSLAFAAVERGDADSALLWLYAPNSPMPIDIFSCGELPPSNGIWSLAGTAAASSTFAIWRAPRRSEKAFFFAARGNVDSDGDGIPDGRERLVYGTRADVEDSDKDGLPDIEELYRYGTDPTKKDCDGDGVWDGEDAAPFTPGPQLTITSPPANMTLTNTPVMVSGIVNYTGALDTVRVAGIRATTYASGNGTYLFSCNLDLDEGSHEIVVRAASADQIPLESKTSVTAIVDALPPDITILTPADPAASSGANIRVSAWTDSTNDSVTINGYATFRDGYLRYAWVPLQSLGTNIVRATAMDNLGRVGADAVVVVCTNSTPIDPNDDDCDGIPNPEDPEPSNPSVKGALVITAPLNGTLIRSR